MAAALKNEGIPQEIFMKWSRTAPGKFDEDVAKRTWDSVGKEYAEEITFGTLLHLAKKYSGENMASAFIQPPTEMLKAPTTDDERIRQAAEMINTLFKPGENFELCAGGLSPDGKRTIPIRRGENFHTLENTDTTEILTANSTIRDLVLRSQHGGYIGMNPVQDLASNTSVKATSDDMIADFRIALLECDELPLPEQWNTIIKMRIPVVSVIFSGNKSLHILCRIDAGGDRELYRKRVTALYQYAAAHGLTPDQACKNASRLTRCPGFKRGDKLQYLVSRAWGYPDWASFEKHELQKEE